MTTDTIYLCPKCGHALTLKSKLACVATHDQSAEYDERYICPDCGATWDIGDVLETESLTDADEMAEVQRSNRFGTSV